MKYLAQAILLVALSTLSGCMGVEEANQHLSSMDKSTETLSASVSDDQQYLKSFSDQMQLMEKHMSTLEDELSADREYLKAVTESMKAMSDTLQALQAMGDDAIHIVLDNLMKPAPTIKPVEPTDILPPLPPTQTPPKTIEDKK